MVASIYKEKPLISILMNCFNGEQYLREAIESVLNQTYTNWEIIFWDNQSCDKSASIFKGYGDERFRYFYAPKHTTLGQARNLAFGEAKGEWIAFLDADDLWLENKLDKQVKIIIEENGELGFVYGRCEYFYETGNKRKFVSLDGLNLIEGNIFSSLAVEDYVPFVSGLVHRERFVEVGGFPEHFKHATDYYMFIHLAYKYRVRAVQDVCCRYRIHDNNLSHSQHIISARESIEIISDFLPDPRSILAIKYKYAILAIACIREGEIMKAIKTIIKYRVAAQFTKRVIAALFRRFERVIINA